MCSINDDMWLFYWYIDMSGKQTYWVLLSKHSKPNCSVHRIGWKIKILRGTIDCSNTSFQIQPFINLSDDAVLAHFCIAVHFFQPCKSSTVELQVRVETHSFCGKTPTFTTTGTLHLHGVRPCFPGVIKKNYVLKVITVWNEMAHSCWEEKISLWRKLKIIMNIACKTYLFQNFEVSSGSIKGSLCSLYLFLCWNCFLFCGFCCRDPVWFSDGWLSRIKADVEDNWRLKVQNSALSHILCLPSLTFIFCWTPLC